MLDGPPEKCAIRLAEDPGLALEINHRKYEAGAILSVWEAKDGQGKVRGDWACQFCGNPDSTLSPHNHPELAVGVEKGAQAWQMLQLVPRGDARQLVFEGSEWRALSWFPCSLLCGDVLKMRSFLGLESH